MIIDAIQLLSEREIVHPSRVNSSSLAGGQFQLSIAGHPWWRDTPKSGEDMITFLFSGVTDGEISLTDLLDHDEDEALEEFEISLTSTLDWAQPNQFSIYCSAPLPRALAVWTAVENYLVNARAPREPSDFLNGGDRLSEFLQITASPGYQLAACPASIHGLVIRELQNQSVPHTVVETAGRAEGRLFVRLGRSTFFCKTALAEFD